MSTEPAKVMTPAETEACCRKWFCGAKPQNESEKEKELPWFDVPIILLAMTVLSGVWTMAISSRFFVAWIANLNTAYVQLLLWAALVVWLVYDLMGMVDLVKYGKRWYMTLVRVVAIVVILLADVLYCSYYTDWIDPFALIDGDSGMHRPRLYTVMFYCAVYALVFGTFWSNRIRRYEIPTPACCAKCCMPKTGGTEGEKQALTPAERDNTAELRA